MVKRIWKDIKTILALASKVIIMIICFYRGR
jgi:hypothetical protein